MNVTIDAASCVIGRQLFDQSVEAGHHFAAVVRNSNRLSKAVRAFATDLTNADAMTLHSAIKGADAVLSGLGARSAADVGVGARGSRAILQAMRGGGVDRIFVTREAPLGTCRSSV